MKKILLIEDDPFLLDIYTVKLKHSGFKVDVAVDGEQALEKIKSSVPDLIFLDLMLPLVDGWQILKSVRERDEFAKVPVFILSNIGQPEDVKKAMDMGATKYFIKADSMPSQIVDHVMNFFNHSNG
jgi:DNA-binding response OmpR family regulator